MAGGSGTRCLFRSSLVGMTAFRTSGIWVLACRENASLIAQIYSLVKRLVKREIPKEKFLFNEIKLKQSSNSQ